MKHDLLITLDKERPIPLSRQIYEQVRNAIHIGALSVGDPLPPSRSLAVQLGVSRSVILESYEYLQAEGYLEMRKGAGTFVADLIARLLRSTRSMPVVPEQIVITSGATQAMDILARIFLSVGDRVLVEDPSHRVVCEIFAFAGAEVIPVSVDMDGISVEEMRISSANTKAGSHEKAPMLVYVTPSHQFPLGVTLSLNRRVQLLEWAKANHAFIIEDDYDSEFGMRGRNCQHLQDLM